MAGKKKQEAREGSRHQLRAEAEKKVARSADKSAPLKKQDLDKLVQELQVHQVELEMQNEELRTAQGQLNKSRNDYVDLYDFAPVGYFTFNDKALITEVNLTGAALLGVERQKLLKRRFRQFVAPADAERWDRHFVSVLQQGEKQSCDLLIRRKDGSTLYARLDSIRVEMDDGTCVVRTAMSDITVEKQAVQSREENEKNYRLLAENTTDIVLIMDMDLNITWISASVHKMSGFSVEEEKSMPLDKRLAPESVKKSIEFFTRILHAEKEGRVVADGYLDMELEIYHKDGSTFWTENRLKFIRDNQGKAIGVLMQGRDIAERKQAEEALRESEQSYRALAAYHMQLNDISISFAEASNTEDLFNKIAETFRLLTGAIAASFQVFDKKTRALKIVSLSIDPISRDNLDSIFEPEFFETEMPVSTDLEELMINLLITKPKDLCELTLGTMSQDLSNTFMDAIGCQQIVALAITYAKELVGTCIAYLQGDKPMVPDDALKTFTYIAGLAVKRRKAEEALKASEAQYRLLSEHTTDTVWLMDMNLNFIYNSPSVEKLRGFTAQEIMEMPWQQHVTPESLKLATEVILREIPRVLAEPDYNPILALELEYTCKNGTTVWAESKFSIVRDESGKPVSILGEARDITERRKTDELLRVSEAQYRWLSEHITDGVWLLDMNLKPTYQSPSMEKLTGFTHQELMDLPFEKRVTPESLKLAAELYLELMPEIMTDSDYSPTRTLELEYYCKDGTTLWTENKLSGIRDENGRPLSILAEVRDITERLQAEESLRQSEVKYRTVLEQMEEAYYEVDLAGNLTFFNDATCHQLGYSIEELMGMNYRVYTSKDDMPRVYETYNQVFRTGKPNTGFSVCRIRKDGARVFTENSALPLRNKDGKIIGFRGVARDITKRLQAEDTLRESEAQYRLLSEHTTDVIWLTNRDLKTIYISPSVQKLRGFSPQEIMEMPLEKQVTPESLKFALELFSEELPRVEADPGYNPVHTLELEFYCRDGTTCWAETIFSVIRDASGKPVSMLGEGRDITRRREAERKLEQSLAALEKTMGDTVIAISKMVEMKDPFTAGHQIRVAQLASAMAKKMNLTDEQVTYLNTAATIHDIGKIYVPSDILSKPGKLGAIEFQIIQAHVQGSYDILKEIDFSGPIAQIVYQHHERLDGSGYPRGLKGADILPEAKILIVADVVEAMSSHRPYRAALGIEKALEEIADNRGSKYDEAAVDACLDLFSNGQFEFKPV